MNMTKTLILLTILIISLACLQAMPVTTVSGNNDLWNNTDQIITLSCTDDNSPDTNCLSIWYKIDSDENTITNDENTIPFTTELTITEDGNHQINFQSTSTDGNTDDTEPIYVAIDKIAPVTTISGNSATTTNANQIITLTCSDTNSDINYSGCSSIKYKIDAATNFLTYTAPVTISTDGNHAFRYYSIDNATNDENEHLAYISIDKAPIITSEVTSIKTTSAKIKITLNESGECGYSTDKDDDSYGNMDHEEDAPVTWSITGLKSNTTYKYYVICVDDSEIESNRKTVSFTTDKSSSSSSSSNDDDDEEDSDFLELNATAINSILTGQDLLDFESLLKQNNFDLTNKTIITNNTEIEVIREAVGSVLKGNGSFIFTITVKNKTASEKVISIIEIIPKELAATASKVIFTTPVTKIIKEDPIALWEITVPANSEKEIVYRVRGVTNNTVIKNDTFIANWKSPVALIDKDPNAVVQEEAIDAPETNNTENTDTTAGITGNVSLQKRPLNIIWLYILGGIFGIAMLGLGVVGIIKNSNPMARGFRPSLFNSNKRRRR